MSEWCLFDYIVALILIRYNLSQSISPLSLSLPLKHPPSRTKQTNNAYIFIFYDIVLLVDKNKLLWAFKCHNIIIIIIIIIITVNSHGFLSL